MAFEEVAPPTQDEMGSPFFRFEKLGDTCQGVLMSITKGVQGNFGKEDHYKINTPDGIVTMSARGRLAVHMNKSAPQVANKIRVKFAREIDVGKEDKMKDYDVAVDRAVTDALKRYAAGEPIPKKNAAPPPPPPPKPAADDEDAPF